MASNCRAAGLFALCLLGLPASAAASVVAELEMAADEEKISEMLVLGKRAVAEYPKEAVAHLWYGVANLWACDMELAKKHLERARELAPSFEVHYYLFHLYFGNGEFDAARQALALARKQGEGSEGLAEIETIARVLEPYQPATPAEQALMGMIERVRAEGARAVALLTHPQFVKDYQLVMKVDRFDADAFVEGFEEGFGGDAKWIGHRLERSGRAAPPEAEWLLVHAAVFVTMTPRKLAMFAELMKTDKSLANPELAWSYERMNEADQAAFLKRMEGQRVVSFVYVDVLLAQHEGQWRALDAVFDGKNTLREQLPKMANLRDSGALTPPAAAGARAERNLAYRVGRLVGIFVALTLAGLLIARLRRKKTD